MIRASVITENQEIIVFGLSYQNLKRLKNGEAIRIDMTEMGIPDQTIIIFSGVNEKKMVQMTKDLIGPDTQVHDYLQDCC